MVGFHEVDNRPINPKNLWVASGARVKNFLNRDERVGRRDEAREQTSLLKKITGQPSGGSEGLG